MIFTTRDLDILRLLRWCRFIQADDLCAAFSKAEIHNLLSLRLIRYYVQGGAFVLTADGHSLLNTAFRDLPAATPPAYKPADTLRRVRQAKMMLTAYTAANIKLRRLNAKYKEFSEAAGLPEQRERLKVLYTDDTSKAAAENLKLQRDAEAPIRADIGSGKYPLTLNPEKQARHMAGTAASGRSVVTISAEELQDIINAKAGSGKILFQKGTFVWQKREIIDAGKEIGYTIDMNGDIISARSLKIHYSKTGTHVVPRSKEWEK